MPQVYITQKEVEALEFLVGVAHAASESATDEVFCREYDSASEAYSSLEKKISKAKAKQKGQTQIKRVLRQIESG
ncbi:hypothetical protein [Pseudoalteromonas ruthenica]|uniref:hypothetical protein n=1 Tax=Pseudoalteromonas ruthenica TaxID=151081 RepID=UPI00110BC8FF|nr:hypothetical protein [Pseudoalteromonas ruthenica]TMO87680.1 hypothetical protein CWC12_10400 [Pseudoalteromonas ruthenica]TMP20851.1 hypothetical protein CWC06_19520 [Pseudoalteromonas ruthenica]